MIRTIFVILIYVNINSNFSILCISKQYIYISRLQEGTEFSSIEVSSRVKPSRNGVCVHQNRWPALESARPSVTWFCPYLIVQFSMNLGFLRRKIVYIYEQNISITRRSIHHELPYRIFIPHINRLLFDLSVAYSGTDKSGKSIDPRPFQPQYRQHSSRLW